MQIFVTSDLHLGHYNIIKYCNRPFKGLNDMNDKLIYNWNQCVKPDDVVYHLGDFCFYGGQEGGLTKSQVWESQLNGKIIHIRGNHDKNNGVKAYSIAMVIQHAHHNIGARHCPIIDRPENEFFDYSKLHFLMCGHVHEKWKFKYLEHISKWVINVGTDVWNFRPILLNQVVVEFQRLQKLQSKEIINGEQESRCEHQIPQI